MDEDVRTFLGNLQPDRCDAVEVSGNRWADLGWQSHTVLEYPDFDLTAPRAAGTFDVVICEQVLEHVDDPQRAAVTLASLCRPGGKLVVSTPFMLRIHPSPEDHWRFTPSGLRLLLERAGFTILSLQSWGNTWCITKNRRRWAVYRRHHRILARWSLRNEPNSPQVVWAFAEPAS